MALLHRIIPTAAQAIALGAALLAGTAAPAVETVYLRGYQVTPQHVVFGVVEELRGDSAVANIGYAHGLKLGTALLAVRRVDEQLIPVSGLTVTHTEPDHSRARVEGPFRIQPGDFVLVHASRLNLWSAEDRLDQLLRQRIVRRKSKNGYNTLDASVDLIDEVARDDEFLHRAYSTRHPEEFIVEAELKVGPAKGLLGAVHPVPVIREAKGGVLEEPEEPRDPTVEAITRFVEAAATRDALLERISTDRLQRLRTIGAAEDVDESNAPLKREILLAWTARVLTPA